MLDQGYSSQNLGVPDRENSAESAMSGMSRGSRAGSRAGRHHRKNKSNQTSLQDLMIHHKCDRHCQHEKNFHKSHKQKYEDSERIPYHYESGIAGLHKMHKKDNTYGDKRMDRIINHYQKDKNIKTIKTLEI
jgi:hypothetical protein